MLKKFLPFLALLLMTGCAGSLSRLTPLEQPRNQDNLYPVEMSFTSSQQSIRWDSVHANILLNGNLLPMRPVEGVPNRWEGLVPVPPGQNSVDYQVKFDYFYNAFGHDPKPSSMITPVYTLHIIDQ